VIGTTVFDNPIKGLDILIKSFAVLHGRMPEAHLLIVGVDPTVAENAKLTTTLGIASVTHWAAIRDDGWRYLNAADIYVQPSRSEGLGLAIIEAMALELPVVASRVGGIPEAVEDGVSGALVPPEDEAALSNKLQELAQNGTLRNAMGKAGQQRYLEHFRGETSAQVLLERYADIAP